ncbi:MAG: DUF2281 domain-containing protein [Verrucomicrobiota bacterium]
MSTETLVAKFQALPPTAQKQVEVFIDFLTQQSRPARKSRQRPGFKFNWEGGLEDLKDKYTAVELQHAINELR